MSAPPPPAPPAPQTRSWLGLLLPALFAFIVLIGLGTWQVERKAWKEALIASLTERLAAPPQALPAPATWPKLDPADDEYRRVKFTALFDNAAEALVYGAASAFRPDVSGPGYWVFTPARLSDGGIVMVNRGFVPEGRKDPKSRAAGEISGPVAITGALRWPDTRHWFTPADDAAHNLWFNRDPQAIAAAKGLGAVAPFFVEMEAPAPPGGLPSPGKIVVNLPNNHLQYAITWYGLAAALVGVFVIFARSSFRGAGKAREPGIHSHRPPGS
ncbi:MAG TPA: SURF1 family protein [Xanthobacteraceae bacterium]|nr:SURF1 family protein [Xanthobacteraceae bacterium]